MTYNFSDYEYTLIFEFDGSIYKYKSFLPGKITDPILINKRIVLALSQTNIPLLLNDTIVEHNIPVPPNRIYIGVYDDLKKNIRYDIELIADDIIKDAYKHMSSMKRYAASDILLGLALTCPSDLTYYIHNVISKRLSMANKTARAEKIRNKYHLDDEKMSNLAKVDCGLPDLYMDVMCLFINNLGEFDTVNIKDFYDYVSPELSKLLFSKKKDIVITHDFYTSLLETDFFKLMLAFGKIISGATFTFQDTEDEFDYYSSIDVTKEATARFSNDCQSEFAGFIVKYLGKKSTEEIDYGDILEFINFPAVSELLNLFEDTDFSDVFELFNNEELTASTKDVYEALFGCQENGDNISATIEEYYLVIKNHNCLEYSIPNLYMHLAEFLEMLLFVAVYQNTEYENLYDYIFTYETGSVKKSPNGFIQGDESEVLSILLQCVLSFRNITILRILNHTVYATKKAVALSKNAKADSNHIFANLKKEVEEEKKRSQKKLNESNKMLDEERRNAQKVANELEALKKELALEKEKTKELLGQLQISDEASETKANAVNITEALHSLKFASCGGRDNLLAELKKSINIANTITKTSSSSVKCDCVLIFTDYLDHATFNACMSYADKKKVPYMYISKATNTDLVLKQIYNNAAKQGLLGG